MRRSAIICSFLKTQYTIFLLRGSFSNESPAEILILLCCSRKYYAYDSCTPSTPGYARAAARASGYAKQSAVALVSVSIMHSRRWPVYGCRTRTSKNRPPRPFKHLHVCHHLWNCSRNGANRFHGRLHRFPWCGGMFWPWPLPKNCTTSETRLSYFIINCGFHASWRQEFRTRHALLKKLRRAL